MKKCISSILGILGIVTLILTGCKSKSNEAETGFPSALNAGSDADRVAYVMQNATPDSVARFVCMAAIGRVPGTHIDTMAIATAYAYDHYNDADRETFGEAMDRFVEALPLADRMLIYRKAGADNMQGLGYELGLEYLARIRENQMSLQEVDQEIEAFKEACVDDTLTYNRFLIGLKTAIIADSNNSVPAAVAQKYGRISDN